MKSLILLFFAVCCLQVSAQKQTSNCKVLSVKLQDSYVGECKNRLANGEGTARGVDTYEGKFKDGVPHGKGKYVYQDGSYYTGEFKNGLRHGEGTFHEMNKETATITSGKLGLWKNDEFIEEVLEKKYQLIQSINTMSIQFDKPDERQERAEIYLGSRSVLSGITVNSSTGNSVVLGNNRIVIENCSYPLRVKLSYNAQKGVSQTINVRVEFELESKGHWKINVNSQ